MKVERPSGWGIYLLPIGGEGWRGGTAPFPEKNNFVLDLCVVVY